LIAKLRLREILVWSL